MKGTNLVNHIEFGAYLDSYKLGVTAPVKKPEGNVIVTFDETGYISSRLVVKDEALPELQIAIHPNTTGAAKAPKGMELGVERVKFFLRGSDKPFRDFWFGEHLDEDIQWADKKLQKDFCGFINQWCDQPDLLDFNDLMDKPEACTKKVFFYHTGLNKFVSSDTGLQEWYMDKQLESPSVNKSSGIYQFPSIGMDNPVYTFNKASQEAGKKFDIDPVFDRRWKVLNQNTVSGKDCIKISFGGRTTTWLFMEGFKDADIMTLLKNNISTNDSTKETNQKIRNYMKGINSELPDTKVFKVIISVNSDGFDELVGIDVSTLKVELKKYTEYVELFNCGTVPALGRSVLSHFYSGKKYNFAKIRESDAYKHLLKFIHNGTPLPSALAHAAIKAHINPACDTLPENVLAIIKASKINMNTPRLSLDKEAAISAAFSKSLWATKKILTLVGRHESMINKVERMFMEDPYNHMITKYLEGAASSMGKKCTKETLHSLKSVAQSIHGSEIYNDWCSIRKDKTYRNHLIIQGIVDARANYKLNDKNK